MEKMADEMEDENCSELDLDYLQFKHQQLSIFKHDYRETSSRAIDEAHQKGFQLGFNKSIELSKKIGRLKGTLVALQNFTPHNNESLKVPDVKNFVDQCETLLNQLAAIKSDQESDANDGSEFTVDFAKKALPDFDGDDMDLFLGNKSGSVSASDISSKQTKSVSKNVLFQLDQRYNEILTESHLLFDRCCSILHSFGICDEFLYKS